MALLVDLFGYLSVVLHGIAILTQSMAVGGALFLVFLVRPLRADLPRAGDTGAAVSRLAGRAALGLAACEVLVLAMSAALLTGTVGISLLEALSAQSALAGLVKLAAALGLAALLLGRRRPAAAWPLLALGAVELLAATFTTHAVARMEDRGLLFAAGLVHQFGAAVWIGGIPSFLIALHRSEGVARARVVGRFSALSILGVACIAVSASVFAWRYIGLPSGLYGTAYGVMVGAKICLFGGLLLLGLGNFRLGRRLRRDPATPSLRLFRFAEVEIGLGFALFFAAAGLTSAPPAVDLLQDRVSWSTIVERNVPVWPRLSSPGHDALTLAGSPAQLDASAHDQMQAFMPGSGEMPDRNAADIAWSEYNHHWAGVFVLVVGLLALAQRAGWRAARHWPVLFLAMAALLFVRADPEVWPLGPEGVFESLRDVEVLQHRLLVAVVAVFGLFEWRVRAGGRVTGWQPLVFPLVCVVGGVGLLTHSHAMADMQEQLLIEISHTPMALAGVAAGAARWLELRLPGREGRVAGWVWPACFTLIGLILLNYREA